MVVLLPITPSVVVDQIMFLPGSGSPLEVRVAVIVIDSPGTKLKLDGETFKEVGVPTFRIQFSVYVFPMPFPVIVMVYVPRGVALVVSTVRIEVDSPRPGEMMGSLRVTLASLGPPLVDKKITSSAPQFPNVETVIVAVAELPGDMLSLDGSAAIVKPAGCRETLKLYADQSQ